MKICISIIEDVKSEESEDVKKRQILPEAYMIIVLMNLF
jgi:hypothetical protein